MGTCWGSDKGKGQPLQVWRQSTTSTRPSVEMPPIDAPQRTAAFKNMTIPCRVIGVVDGDTLHVVTRASPGEPWAKYTVRLVGVDTPETNGPTKLEQVTAAAVTEYLRFLVFADRGSPGPVGQLVCSSGVDKYRRLLGDVRLPGIAPLGLGAHLLHAKLGRAYQGKTKLPWTLEALRAVRTRVATLRKLSSPVPEP